MAPGTADTRPGDGVNWTTRVVCRYAWYEGWGGRRAIVAHWKGISKLISFRTRLFTAPTWPL
eukprot:2103342-Prymnesium_polylepis.1